VSKTKTTGKAAASRGAAAVAESNGVAPTVDFHGLELRLPPKLPGTLAFTIARIERSNGNSLSPIIDCIQSVVGAEQVAAIESHVAAKEIALDDVGGELDGLLSKIVTAYGVEAGESSASVES
jgi:hypothetical protein